MLMRLASQVVKFPLDQTVNIPRRLAEYVRGDRVLFVAITKASYVSVNAIGAEFVALFERGVTLGAALTIVKNKYGIEKEEQITKILSGLLTQIEARKFYEDAQVVDDTLKEFTMLARLTNRCNLRCAHCLVSSAPDWPTVNDLNTGRWCEITEQYSRFAKERGFDKARVTFTGGEALSRRDAIEILQHSKSLNIYTELFTNGVLIVNSRMAATIANAVNEVQVSFDGATAPVHDRIRGIGMFDRTVRGVRFLAETNVKYRLAITVMPQNYEDLMNNLPALVEDLGCKFRIRLGLAVQEGRATHDMTFKSTQEGENKIQTLIQRMCDLGLRYPRSLVNNFKKMSCGYARELTVNSDGLVFGCGPIKYPIGNLNEESFYSIADRTIHKSKRAEIDSVEGCRDCNVRYLCGGICRLNNKSRMGSHEISCCDLANKERVLTKLFGYASNIVPVAMLSNNVERRNS